MTIAIYQPARGRHHMHRRSLAARIWTWLTGETGATIPAKHPGAIDGEDAFEPEPIDDPLHPEYPLFEPALEPAHLYDEITANLPTRPDWEPSWLKSFTAYYQAIPVPDDDQQPALTAGTGGTR